MVVQLFLAGIALLLRALGSVGRRAEQSVVVLWVAWMIALTATWLGVIIAGGWVPLWPLLPVSLLAFLPHEKRGFSPLNLFADMLLVLVLGLFALPPLPLLYLGLTAVILGLVMLAIDLAVAWLYRRLGWQILVGAIVAALLLIALLPPLRDMAWRVANNRFAYLLPDTSVSTLPTPRPVSAATAVATPTFMPIVAHDSVSGLDAKGQQWLPYLEWVLPNGSYEGNPFDVVATATFVHTSGESRTTGMFYGGDDTWRFRFTATQPGVWQVTTSSADPELNGRSGTITIAPNPVGIGFVTNYGNKWGRTGVDRAFVPQFVMIGGPQTYYNNPAEIQYNIDTFFVQHGFNGVHTAVFCRWFDLEQQACSRINEADPNPDLRTFAALESLITQVHAAGGVVHIWMWGDDSRSENPKRWGINSPTDLRLQRYIAARLGPLPGWTMGYGYDLFEWVDGQQLTAWHDYMQAQLGWAHYLGARASTNQLNQLAETMDYSAYEQHRPSYDDYVAAIEARPDKPSFSEDRFRIRDEGRAKDYTMELTRRGLWQSVMAGGVANIWGNLIGAPLANDTLTTSAPYPNPEMIQTYARFWQGRFWADMVRCNALTSGMCLQRPSNDTYVFYAENTSTIQLDLSGMTGSGTAVAVDTLLPYAEIPLGNLAASNQTWTAPYASDWAIVILP